MGGPVLPASCRRTSAARSPWITAARRPLPPPRPGHLRAPPAQVSPADPPVVPVWVGGAVLASDLVLVPARLGQAQLHLGEVEDRLLAARLQQLVERPGNLEAAPGVALA